MRGLRDIKRMNAVEAVEYEDRLEADRVFRATMEKIRYRERMTVIIAVAIMTLATFVAFTV